MPRTAITLAKGHDGKWSVLASPDDSLVEQLANLKTFRVSFSNEKYAEIHYQESDGYAFVHRMRTPQAHKEHEERRAKETQSAIDAAKPKTPVKPEQEDPEQKKKAKK